MREGSVFQRHTTHCPRAEDGSWRPHKCRGSWSYYIDLGRGYDGKRRQASRAGFRSKTEAVAALRAVQRFSDEGNDHAPNLLVGTYLENWLTSKRSLRPSTRQAYRSHLDLYLLPRLGHLTLQGLRPHHIDRFFAEVAGGTRKPLSSASLHRLHATLRSALASAVKRRLISNNPASHVELPSRERVMEAVWTVEDVHRFLTYVADDRLAALYRVAIVTGLRRGELVGLRWLDIDLVAGAIRVVQQVVQLGTQLHLGRPKTRSGERLVAVDLTTVALLEAHRERQRREQEAWGSAWHQTGHVFTYQDGHVLQPDYVTHKFRRDARRAGLPSIRFHGLRHTSASLALAAGVPMKVVSDRLGHSTTTITADLYSHVLPVVARDAADAIGALFETAEQQSSSKSLANPSATSD